MAAPASFGGGYWRAGPCAHDTASGQRTARLRIETNLSMDGSSCVEGYYLFSILLMRVDGVAHRER